jgi:hypothetical protein
MKHTEEQYQILLIALREISLGMGRYSLDPLTHASNTIKDMKQLALEAISKVEVKL